MVAVNAAFVHFGCMHIIYEHFQQNLYRNEVYNTMSVKIYPQPVLHLV
jgi:hypothetical protein